jgi:hypothetical protein
MLVSASRRNEPSLKRDFQNWSQRKKSLQSRGRASQTRETPRALPRICEAARFPNHEIVERIFRSQYGELDDGGIVHKSEEWDVIGN